MKFKFSILLFLCFFMIASVPSYAQANTTEIKQENQKDKKTEEPKSPPVEVQKDEISLIVTETGTMIQIEDESKCYHNRSRSGRSLYWGNSGQRRFQSHHI